MSVRFLHTADWQLGKPFAGIEDASKRALVQQERLAVIERIGEAARAGGAEFVLVAGDLFDSPRATKATVAGACAAIGKLALPVFAIPGNHDHGGPGSLWEQSFFLHEKEHLAPNLRVLLAPEPVELENAVLLPCPLLRRHENADTTVWLRALDVVRFGEKPRIVLAHGSVQGFAEEDGAINRLELARLGEAEFDYLALGDWHGTKQVGPKAWYAGTPELDRFAKGEGNQPGHVLLVTAARGALPVVEPVRTARLGWHRLACDFAEDADLVRLESEVEALLGQRAQSDLLELALTGALGIEATTRLAQKLEAWEARLLRLTLAQEVRVAPTPDEIAALTQRASDPLIARVAARLLEREGDAAAEIALRELHAMCAGL
jgi:DNA repair exonuclease SbcCD nuclease subunit